MEAIFLSIKFLLTTAFHSAAVKKSLSVGIFGGLAMSAVYATSTRETDHKIHNLRSEGMAWRESHEKYGQEVLKRLDESNKISHEALQRIEKKTDFLYQHELEKQRGNK